jgi:hypothetical protein
LLAEDNAVPYDPALDASEAYARTIIPKAQAFRGLARSLQAESEWARNTNQPDLAADYAIACIELSQMLGRGGITLDALVGRALEGVGYAQLAKLRGEMSPGKLRAVIAALKRSLRQREDGAALRARETDFDERARGFSARLENMFVRISGKKVPWEGALDAATRRHGAVNVLLQADLAIRLFAHEQGRLPHNLGELVPDYLSALPLDPYDDQPVRFKVEGSRFTVYSVGRDGEDNGGRFGNGRTYGSSPSGYDFDLETPIRP